MSYYKMVADQFREYLHSSSGITPEERAETERYIKALDFIDECNKQDQLKLIDTGAFDNVMKGYVAMAANRLKLTDDEKNALLTQMRILFDTVTAEEAEQYYFTHEQS